MSIGHNTYTKEHSLLRKGAGLEEGVDLSGTRAAALPKEDHLRLLGRANESREWLPFWIQSILLARFVKFTQ